LCGSLAAIAVTTFKEHQVQLRFERRMLYLPVFHIDTNLINARQKLPEVNRLEKWCADEVILINMSGTAHEEAQADGNVLRMRKAAQHNYTIDAVEQELEPSELFGKVCAALGAQSENQKNDARIVCTAIKYHATLVTNDGGSKSQPGGILGNRDKIRAIADLQIMTPAEAVALVEGKVAERDAFNRRIAGETGTPLPPWTGAD
jgi:hypothetical protein